MYRSVVVCDRLVVFGSVKLVIIYTLGWIDDI